MLEGKKGQSWAVQIFVVEKETPFTEHLLGSLMEQFGEHRLDFPPLLYFSDNCQS